MTTGKPREVRTLWRSTDGGKTWEVFGARPGSFLWALEFPSTGVFNDGYSLYRNTDPATS